MKDADLQLFPHCYYPVPSPQCVPGRLSKTGLDHNLTTYQEPHIPSPNFSRAWHASHCPSVSFQLHIHAGIQNSLDRQLVQRKLSMHNEIVYQNIAITTPIYS